MRLSDILRSAEYVGNEIRKRRMERFAANKADKSDTPQAPCEDKTAKDRLDRRQ